MKTSNKFIFVLAASVFFLSSKTTLAQNTVEEPPNNCDLVSDLELAKYRTEEDKTTDDKKIESSTQSKRVAVAGISVPGLWWAKEQFDPFGGRLINDWLTHPNFKKIDLTVNWQLWTLLDYLGRYRFLNQFGTVAREYGYELRVFDRQKQCLGIYEYNLNSNPPKWEIKLDNSGQDSLPVKPINN